MAERQSERRAAPGVAIAGTLLTLLAVQSGMSATGPGHRMVWDASGMVMGENRGDELPFGCDGISADVRIEVRVGRKHAQPGFAFGYTEHEWQVPPCSRVTVTLANDDDVRHMWMLHGLPNYIYHQGMFHMEVEGGQELTGTFVTPDANETFFVHCDIAQHTEKGLKAQLKVGRGSGDLPSIPGLTAPAYAGE